MSDIFEALDDNNLFLLEKLLTEGQDVNRRDHNGQTVLHKACALRKPEAVKLIFKHKPNINLQDEGSWTPLHYLCYQGDLDSVFSLLEYGPDVNIGDTENRTPLWLATNKNHVEVVRLLLSGGADPNLADSSYNSSPLHEAKSGAVVKLLVDFGAKIETTDSDDDTPLIEAARNGRLSAVQGLCELGANINHTGWFGRTALHRAIDRFPNIEYMYQKPDVRIIKYLLSQQADVSIVDDDDKTAVDLANETAHQNIVDIITSYTEGTTNIKGN